jgi:pyrroloquinoline quinone biosynthesis protein B
MEVILLGTAQDGGVPQAGCACARCSAARKDPAKRQFVASLGVIDRAAQASWMIDATPDFREQLHLLHEAAPGCVLKGIWLTHAHMGHATARVCAYLRANEPWATLARDGFIDLRAIDTDTRYALAGGTITALDVPHRAEYSDTVAYSLRAEHGAVFYCPDIDRWEQWRHAVFDVVSAHTVSLVDGSFFTDGELARDMSAIPHPLVTDTVERLRGLRDKTLFIHLNHSNPLLNQDSEQRRWLRERGCDIGETGAVWQI